MVERKVSGGGEEAGGREGRDSEWGGEGRGGAGVRVSFCFLRGLAM